MADTIMIHHGMYHGVGMIPKDQDKIESLKFIVNYILVILYFSIFFSSSIYLLKRYHFESQFRWKNFFRTSNF